MRSFLALLLTEAAAQQAQAQAGGCPVACQQCVGAACAAPACAVPSCQQPQTQQVVRQQMVKQQITTQETESECSWEVEVEWQPPATIYQWPVFNLEEVNTFEPKVSMRTEEIKHIHYRAKNGCDKDECPCDKPDCCNTYCTQIDGEKSCPHDDRNYPHPPASVTIEVKEEKKAILRVVPQVEHEVLQIPSFDFRIHEERPQEKVFVSCASCAEPQEPDTYGRKAHFLSWGIIDIPINRPLPDVDEGECPQAQYKFKCHRSDTVKQVQHEVMVPQQIVENRVVQPPPAATCSTCNCAQPTTACQSSGCCR